MNRKLLPALSTVGAGAASGRPIAAPAVLVKTGWQIVRALGSSRGTPAI